MPLFDEIRFDAAGLVPVVVQARTDGRVLMLAHANREAIERTIGTGWAHYYSRSRASLWKKGETSGHVQRVAEVRVDCDGDAVLYVVDPAGPACHTGETSCFFRRARDGALEADGRSPADLLAALAAVIQERKRAGAERSYVRALLDGGAEAIAAKVREEAGEVAEALLAPEGDDALVHEVADLWFHTLVALGSRDVSPAAVLAELRRRFGVSGLEEKAARVAKAP